MVLRVMQRGGCSQYSRVGRSLPSPNCHQSGENPRCHKSWALHPPSHCQIQHARPMSSQSPTEVSRSSVCNLVGSNFDALRTFVRQLIQVRVTLQEPGKSFPVCRLRCLLSWRDLIHRRAHLREATFSTFPVLHNQSTVECVESLVAIQVRQRRCCAQCCDDPLQSSEVQCPRAANRESRTRVPFPRSGCRVSARVVSASLAHLASVLVVSLLHRQGVLWDVAHCIHQQRSHASNSRDRRDLGSSLPRRAASRLVHVCKVPSCNERVHPDCSSSSSSSSSSRSSRCPLHCSSPRGPFLELCGGGFL